MKTCIVHNCVNDSSQGEMIGDMCWPCHMFVTGQQSSYSQAYRNAKEVVPAGYILVPKEEFFILIEGEDVHGDDHEKAYDTMYEIAESLIKAAQEKS